MTLKLLVDVYKQTVAVDEAWAPTKDLRKSINGVWDWPNLQITFEICEMPLS